MRSQCGFGISWGVVATLAVWAGCASYRPVSDAYVESNPDPAGVDAGLDSGLDVPPLTVTTPRFEPAPAHGSDADLPANPAVWGEGAERAVGRRFAPVYFDFDSATLRPATRRALAEYSAWLEKNPGVWVTLEGHCDSAGSHEYNYNLGMQRALEVRLHLASLGTPPDRLFVISYGEDRPAVEETTPAAADLNRRVEFRAFRAPAGYDAPPVSGASAAPPELKEPDRPLTEASDLP